MRPTRSQAVALRHPGLQIGLVVLVAVVAACGGPLPSPSPSPDQTIGPTIAPSTPAAPTEVPGGQTSGPINGGESLPPILPTTQTEWGLIVDRLPPDFPVFPGAEIAEPPAEPVSGAFISPAGVDEVATWYGDALEAAGKSTVDLTSPLEDGSRMLDMQGDLPECRLRVIFRPAGESTMITVLLAAGCYGGEG